MKKVLGIAEVSVSNQAEDVIITYALGSCLGITAWDPVTKVGGMVHVMVPSSTIDPDRAATNPGTYVDTGIATLLSDVIRAGATKARLVITAAGGAETGGAGQGDFFQIGKRNFVALKQVLWKQGVLLKKHDVGGTTPRTMSLAVGSGEVGIMKYGGTTQYSTL
jgi:chemotaxis protein CheD